MINAGTVHKLHTLLGRAILISAAKHQPISGSLITGIGTLRSALQGKGKRSLDWDDLAKIDLTDPIAVETFRNGVDRKSPTQDFLDALYQILQSPILPPSATTSTRNADSDNIDAAANNVDSLRQTDQDPDTKFNSAAEAANDEDENADSVPDT